MADAPIPNPYVSLLRAVNARVEVVVSQKLVGSDVEAAFSPRAKVPGAALLRPSTLIEWSERFAAQAEVAQAASDRISPTQRRFTDAIREVQASKEFYADAEDSLEQARNLLGGLHQDVELGDLTVADVRSELQMGADNLGQNLAQDGAEVLLNAVKALDTQNRRVSRLTRSRDVKVAGPVLLSAITDAERMIKTVDVGLELAIESERLLVLANTHANNAHHSRIESERTLDVADQVRDIWVDEMTNARMDLSAHRDDASLDAVISEVAAKATVALNGPQKAANRDTGLGR